MSFCALSINPFIINTLKAAGDTPLAKFLKGGERLTKLIHFMLHKVKI